MASNCLIWNLQQNGFLKVFRKNTKSLIVQIIWVDTPKIFHNCLKRISIYSKLNWNVTHDINYKLKINVYYKFPFIQFNNLFVGCHKNDWQNFRIISKTDALTVSLFQNRLNYNKQFQVSSHSNCNGFGMNDVLLFSQLSKTYWIHVTFNKILNYNNMRTVILRTQKHRIRMVKENTFNCVTISSAMHFHMTGIRFWKFISVKIAISQIIPFAKYIELKNAALPGYRVASYALLLHWFSYVY